MAEIEIQHQTARSLPLARIEGGERQAFRINQLRHGDISINPKIFSTFDSVEERAAWIESYTRLEPDYHANDKQSWTYVADYSLHPNTPYLPEGAPLNFFLCAKIDHENKLRFGIFSQIPEKRATISSAALARIQDNKTTPFVHGDRHPPFRIASKEESEAKLLKDGKLIRSALPKFVGVLMDTGKARISLSATTTRITKDLSGATLSVETIAGQTYYSTKQYYGHIWSYWASIIDNTLYFIGIPICKSNERGSVVYTKTGLRQGDAGGSTVGYVNVREEVALPPTEDDLRSTFNINGLLRKDEVSRSSHPLFSAVQEAFGVNNGHFSTQQLLMNEWLPPRLDLETPTTWLSRPVAKIKDKKTQQFTHGDISSNITLMGHGGGVFYDSKKSSFNIAEASEVIYSKLEDAEGKENNNIFASFSEGHSGFMPSRTAYSIEGKTYFSAQCVYASQQGANYSISIIGGNRPFGVFSDEIRDENFIHLNYHLTEIYTKKNPNEAIPEGWGGGGSPAGDNDHGFDGGEVEEGCIGEVYEYEIASIDDSYPLVLTETPDLVSVVELIKSRRPSTKGEVLEIARSIRYELSLNENSRYLKTPHFRYSVQVQADGQDGPFQATVGGKPLGSRTVAIGSMNISGEGSLRYVNFSLTTLSDGDENSPKTVTFTHDYPHEKQNWRLIGSLNWTAADRVGTPSGGKYIKVVSHHATRVKSPEKWYGLAWTERWETVDTINGYTQTTVHTKSFERFFATEAAREAFFLELRSSMQAAGKTFVDPPVAFTSESKSYILVHTKVIRAEITAMKDTMLWNENFTVSKSGEITFTATSGSFEITTINTQPTKTLP